MPQEHAGEDKIDLQEIAAVELSDVVDVSALQEMMNDYYAFTGIGVGITDCKGKVLVGTGWQDICTKFHRVHPESCKYCLESDISLSSGVQPGTFKTYHCKNNMWDIATPIMLGDKHLGNIFLGQFLYDDEEPDYALFRAQARRFGYDEAAYISALDQVPRWSRETVQKAMAFYSKLAQMISRSNYNNIRLSQTLVERNVLLTSLAQSEERFKVLLDASSVGIIIHNNWLILDCNRGLSELTGYAVEELVGMDGTKLIAPDWLALVAQNIQSDYNQSYEIEGLRKDGTHYPLSIKGGCIAYKGGSAHVIEFLDITEQRQAEESLWLMNHVFHTSIAANSVAGLDGFITEANDAFLRTWGFRSKNEVMGRPITYFFNDPNEAAGILTALNETGQWEGEFSAKRGDGSSFIAHGMATEVRDKKGKMTGYQSSCLDITDRKQAEADLLQAKVAAEAANITKSQFLATMSHEIRTPMNGVIGMIELLQHTELTLEQCEYAEKAKKSGIELVHLLNDILDFSKIEADKIELELFDFDLRPMIADIISLMSLHAGEKGLKIISSIDAEVPTIVKGDDVRLRQIIANLLNNAIKFTPKGTVTLKITKDAEDENFVTLRFLVQDSGIGIAADRQDHIFKPFTQADSSTTRRYGGTGLGLTICKRLSELMGGSIGVESIVDEGSTFWFTVVLKKAGVTSPVSSVSSVQLPLSLPKILSAKGSRILLAEDDPTAREIAAMLLKKYGFVVDVAGDGKAALQSLENNDYKLVLMDCMMPELNGYEATAIIRDPVSAVRWHGIPIIALTGNALKEDRDRCMAAGMNDYLFKPVILSDLLAKLEKWLK